ncbi:MAG: hypothetical protein GMKNLPBB_00722 [Myxococcota bacterium]|nr:hypothetical protein [Myxococcota bacterium]
MFLIMGAAADREAAAKPSNPGGMESSGTLAPVSSGKAHSASRPEGDGSRAAQKAPRDPAAVTASFNRFLDTIKRKDFKAFLRLYPDPVRKEVEKQAFDQLVTMIHLPFNGKVDNIKVKSVKFHRARTASVTYGEGQLELPAQFEWNYGVWCWKVW